MKLRVHLSALTRVECEKVIEVPDDTKERDFPEIARREYDNTDGGDYTEDNDYWERGHCWCEPVDTEKDEGGQGG